MALSLDIINKKVEKKADRTAFIVTIIYILSILLLIFLVKLAVPVEEDEGMGILVDFGYTETGLGDEEPDINNPMTKLDIPQPGNPPLSQSVQEKALIQDMDETTSIDANNENKQKNLTVNDKETNTSIKNTSTNRTDHNVEPTKRQVNENALFKGNKGLGSADGSQGNKEGSGNMGDPSGSKSDIYNGTSTGLGDAGDGRGRIGSGLVGRKLYSVPKIVDNSNKKGKIIIKVKVNANGQVISSEYSAQGTTITDSDLIAKCEQAAKKAKFSKSELKDVDYGTLIFNFIVR